LRTALDSLGGASERAEIREALAPPWPPSCWMLGFMDLQGRRIEVLGTVQGVGFRPWIYRIAKALGIKGEVHNDGRGVTIDAFGNQEALDRFLRAIEANPPPAAAIRRLSWAAIPARQELAFTIAASQANEVRQPSIPPDLASCPDCISEVFDERDRRHRYPFTNCTNCGPRFTIALDVPYDRPATSMASFPMCEDCRREYEDPEDRRFHAQPNACPRCGPRLRLLAQNGEEVVADDVIGRAAAQLLQGAIVAVKGIGGFHLACDATSREAVTELRLRKRRDAKPFAVMVRTLAEAQRLAALTEAECELLQSSERPIVLVRRMVGSGLAEEVAPRNPLVGLMLAYTPLHHLLLADVGRPLVMTSANLSDEPIAYRDGDLVRIHDIADLFLIHDREIVTRCDDSVARMVNGAPLLLRRSRGYVPRAIRLNREMARPVLACGAQLKNTFCLAFGESAVLGPHVGDLDDPAVLLAYGEAIDRMERFFAIRPEVIAHDLHPDYVSTAFARARPERVHVPVQHHHAHVASVMAEHGLEGPVVGVAFDGAGYGADGASWGGEVLVATLASFERLATLRPIRLPGGDRAIREVWRTALALVEDAFDGKPPLMEIPLFRTIPEQRLELVRQMVARDLNTPRAHGAGRYFDALGALGLELREARYEGEVALAWNVIADPSERRAYDYRLDRSTNPWCLDLRPMVQEAVADVIAGRDPASISAAFHNTLARGTAAMVKAVQEARGPLPVVLTGGCFQNPRLAEGVVAELGPGVDVRLHRQVPPGDGGIALGQALVADAVTRAKQETGG
jgi:hydrogenase maturation protein HypF